jgi:AraC-like DNA-binding protein
MARPPADDVQGEITNRAMIRLLHHAATRLLPDVDIDLMGAQAGKTALLRMVMERHGPAVVLQVGRTVRKLSDHPVLVALTSAPSGHDVLSRWTRLERFGHTSNRTRLVGLSTEVAPQQLRATVEHYVPGQKDAFIHPVNDLFIWGVLIALLECAGFQRVRAELQVVQRPVLIYADGAPVTIAIDALPADTTCVCLSWSARAVASAAAARQHVESDLRTALRSLFATDLLATWRVGDAAKRLAMSSRSLQRRLTLEGTSFTQVLHRTRVDAAIGFMRDASLGLADVAYCAGFADQAHFTRTFQSQLDVPPSAYRALRD